MQDPAVDDQWMSLGDPAVPPDGESQAIEPAKWKWFISMDVSFITIAINGEYGD